MPTVKIDDREFELEDLSDDVKAQLESLRACEIKIAETQQMMAMLQTARNAYAVALRELLPADESE